MKSCPIATQGRDVQNALQQKQREKGRHHSEKEGTHKHNDEANNRALAPKLGPGDAKPLAPRTPEATRSREDACSGSRQVTHRGEEAEEAAFRNHRDCSGSRELAGNNKGRPRRARAHEQQPGSHRNAWGRPGASNDPATRSSPVRLGGQPKPLPPYHAQYLYTAPGPRRFCHLVHRPHLKMSHPHQPPVPAPPDSSQHHCGAHHGSVQRCT